MKYLKKIGKKWMLIVSVAFFMGGSMLLLTSFDDNRDFETMKHLDIYYNLMKNLNSLYVDKVDASKMVQTSIDEMLKTLDPYTVYIPESKMEDYKFMYTGQYGGVGASIRTINKKTVIAEVYEGFPAQKAGLKPGDVMVDIDGKNLETKTNDEISELLKGQPGTMFTLKVKDPVSGEVKERKITREQIKIESVPYYAMLDGKTGYMILTSFTENSASEVRTALIALQAKGAQSVIFDLRENPGGLLNESVKICNLFVDKGNEIVSTKGKYRKQENVYSTTDIALAPTMPLALVVSRGSASASEIVSGALQDLDRGVVIGQRTFGKGLVQTTCDLSYNTKLKVTTAKYYIPSGRCIQALDYSHRNADGSVGKVPDSLMTEFKTRGGRSVFDGGGIVPDLEIKQEEYGLIVSALLEQNVFFDYANLFYSKHKTIDSANVFTISDEVYDDFVKFASSKNFQFQTESEQILKELETELDYEKYLGTAKDQIDKLKTMIAEEKKNDFKKYKSDICMMLGEEIVGRYFYQKGQIIYSLRFSPEIVEAQKVLADKARYQAIMAGQQGTHLKKQ